MCCANVAGATFLGVFFAVIILGGVGYFAVSRKVKDFSKEVYGTEDLVKGIRRQADEVANSPKSVNSMTKLMEPQIVRDFPEFTWEEFKHRAENMLTSALAAVDSRNVDVLVDASEEVKNQVRTQIEMNATNQVREAFTNIHIHQTEISNYRKANGKCIITIQSALEYYHYKVKEDRVIEGSKERKIQTKYNMELMYIQDADVTYSDTAVSTTCPNCGAPVTKLGHKYCEFCGAAVTPINIKVWSLHKYYEVDYNHV